MTNKTYDIMDLISRMIPPFITFVTVVLTTVGVGDSYVNSIVALIGALGSFYNAFLENSSKKYYEKIANSNATMGTE